MSLDLEFARLIDATPEEVFDAFTDPEGQEAFYGQDDPGWIVRSECDLRVGGTWTVDFGPSTRELYRHRHVFEAIDRPHRLLLACTETRLDGSTFHTQIEFTFEARQGKTLMTMAHRGFPTAALRDEHERGVPNAFSRLVRLMRSRRGRIPTATLGRAGAPFTRLGLGTWAIGGPWRFGWGPVDDAESIAAIRQAVDEGINWVDTAAVYGLGHGEEIVGQALEGRVAGEEVLVCTKCGRKTRPDGTPYGDLRPGSIRAECEASLRRLGVARIDLYQIHWPEQESGTPLEESWSTMAELVDEGKVRWIGVSNFDVEQLERCEAIRHVDSLQPPLSLVQRQALGDVIPWAAAHETGVIVYSPMASGLLSGTFDRDRLESLPPDDMRRRRPEFTEPELSRNLALVERLRAIADELDCSVGELAIAWTLAQDGVTGAIVGARRPNQLNGWLGAADLQLSDEQLRAIDDAIA